MVQEQVEEKTVGITIKAAKVTGRLLAKAMLAVLKKLSEPSHKEGKQSIKSLAKQGASLVDAEITGDNIGSFKRIARKHNVSFALKKDKSETPPKWYVFFKSKDADSIYAAMREYTRLLVKHQNQDNKPSIFDTMAQAKVQMAQTAPPVKNRTVGGHEL